MSPPIASPATPVAPHALQREVVALRARLAEAEETLHAIRQGEVDAVVVSGASGPQVYTLLNADRPYRTFVERMQEGALTLTPDGTILYANQRLGLFLGLPLSDIVGQKFGQFIAAEDQALFNLLLAGRGEAGGRSELALRAADGAMVPVYLSMVEILDEGQEIISAIVTDLRWPKLRMRELTEANAKLVTAMAERERAEAMLRHAQKMEAVGQLTIGIAHDFNNLLAVLGGNLELFLTRTSDAWLIRRVEAGQRAVERGTRLTRQLLAFSRRQSLQPYAMSVNALLLDIEPLVRSSIGGGIRLAFAPGEALAQCLVDSTELQASILNLAKNAKDAMPGGGTLTITTAEAELDGIADGGAGPIRGGRYLLITVTDTGHGMPPEVRDRAFDPFFTTKEVGKGTGLGLSQVYGFIRQSGGHVTIESAPDTGTSVRLYLPRIEATATAPALQATGPKPLATATDPESQAKGPRVRRVLVVEDDHDVRELLVEELESLGYLVSAAESGPKALILLDGGLTVDVVVSDVVMPDGMSGFQLVREIRRRLPGLAIVLTSGMTAMAGVADAATQDLPILRKPYRGDDLSQAIETALDAAAMREPRGAVTGLKPSA
jgi:PAS domain S-box-containing protein